MDKLYIIGNGLDIAHDLPTNLKPDFEQIAENLESIDYFWDLYQSKNNDIWSDFENLLAHPDFNYLEEIFDDFYPDYSSDHESDRDGIITQVDLHGQLNIALDKFASNAEKRLKETDKRAAYDELLDKNGHFLTFNYTHTLESLYDISPQNILHIHGEFGQKNLLLGYPEDNFDPEKYSFDVTQKGRYYCSLPISEYIDQIPDYYIRTAYENLLNKVRGFNKPILISDLQEFISDFSISQIYVIGHSCKIDFEYFKYLNEKYPTAEWIFMYHTDEDDDNDNDLDNERRLVSNLSISNVIFHKN